MKHFIILLDGKAKFVRAENAEKVNEMLWNLKPAKETIIREVQNWKTVLSELQQFIDNPIN